MNEPRVQSRYQVRFDWGLAGGGSIAEGAGVVVWIDALPTAGAPDPLDLPYSGGMLAGSVGNAAVTAQRVLDRQAELGHRLMIAVVAAGTDDGRFAVEDLLAAGAIIDALGDLGVDATSPEAAAAASAFSGLRKATSHLLSGSVTGQEVGQKLVDAAREVNEKPELRTLREFSLPS